MHKSRAGERVEIIAALLNLICVRILLSSGQQRHVIDAARLHAVTLFGLRDVDRLADQ